MNQTFAKRRKITCKEQVKMHIFIAAKITRKIGTHAKIYHLKALFGNLLPQNIKAFTQKRSVGHFPNIKAKILVPTK